MKTKIEWATDVWNPVTGCTKVSEGCRHCYAEGIAHRFWGERKFTDVQCHTDRLAAPFHWKNPRRVFVNSMSDLFHPDVPQEFIKDVWIGMLANPDHTFMILTKRADRMAEAVDILLRDGVGVLPNVWLMVTVENQKAADERVPYLLKTPAARRGVSVEPMLEAVDLLHVQYDNMVEINALTGDYGVYRPLQGYGYNKLDWVICGGETGPGARPMHPDWARSLRNQCQAAGVPFFFKKWGEWINVHPERKDYEYSSPPEKCLTIGDTRFYRVGKKAAGRLLDGREWNEYPEVSE